MRGFVNWIDADIFLTNAIQDNSKSVQVSRFQRTFFLFSKKNCFLLYLYWNFSPRNPIQLWVEQYKWLHGSRSLFIDGKLTRRKVWASVRTICDTYQINLYMNPSHEEPSHNLFITPECSGWASLMTVDNVWLIDNYAAQISISVIKFTFYCWAHRWEMTSHGSDLM